MPVLDLPGVRINYTCLSPSQEGAADGAPIVLVHGLASSLAFWYLRIAPALARTRRVVMFDLRGHGRSSMPLTGYTGASMAADLFGILDRLQIDQAHLIGHSFGGNIALHFACAHPERTASLTLADVRIRSLQPKIDLEEWKVWPRYRGQLEHAGVEIDAAAKEIGFEMFERMARLRLGRATDTQELDSLAASPFSGAGGDAAARRWLDLVETTEIRHDLIDAVSVRPEVIATLRTPTLLLYGEQSHCLPTARRLQQLLEKASFQVVPGAGHFFPAKFPERFVDRLRAFIPDECGRRLAATA